jgi:hypothetical protein
MREHGVHCACKPCRVHGMAHVSALVARSRMLRGDVPGHHLPSRGCVRPTRMSVPLRTSGTDVILGMDWMKEHRAVIQCQEKIDVVVQAQPIATVNQLDDSPSKEDPVVDAGCVPRQLARYAT